METDQSSVPVQSTSSEDTEVVIQLPKPVPKKKHRRETMKAAGLTSVSQLPQEFNWSDYWDTVNKRFCGIEPNPVEMTEKQFITEPFDQRNCGACWAISAASMTADRIALWTRSNPKMLSPSYLIACAQAPLNGCCGGSPDLAAQYIARYGLPEEGDWSYSSWCPPGAKDCTGEAPKCNPPGSGYENPETEQQCPIGKVRFVPTKLPDPITTSSSVVSPSRGEPVQESQRQSYSPHSSQILPGCPDRCFVIGNETRYTIDPESIRSVYTPRSDQETVEMIQLEIFAFGPVVSVYFVYNDFVYAAGKLGEKWKETGGIYIHGGPYQVTKREIDDQRPGRHAVVVIGWGEQDIGEPYGRVRYWIVKNSWDAEWNTGGYCKIGIMDRKKNINVGLGIDIPVKMDGILHCGCRTWNPTVVTKQTAFLSPADTGSTPCSPKYECFMTSTSLPSPFSSNPTAATTTTFCAPHPHGRFSSRAECEARCNNGAPAESSSSDNSYFNDDVSLTSSDPNNYTLQVHLARGRLTSPGLCPQRLRTPSVTERDVNPRTNGHCRNIRSCSPTEIAVGLSVALIIITIVSVSLVCLASCSGPKIRSKIKMNR